MEHAGHGQHREGWRRSVTDTGGQALALTVLACQPVAVGRMTSCTPSPSTSPTTGSAAVPVDVGGKRKRTSAVWARQTLIIRQMDRTYFIAYLGGCRVISPPPKEPSCTVVYARPGLLSAFAQPFFVGASRRSCDAPPAWASARSWRCPQASWRTSGSARWPLRGGPVRDHGTAAGCRPCALFEELTGVLGLDLHVALAGTGTQADLFLVETGLLLLLGTVLLLLFEEELAVVHDTTDRRLGIGSHFHQIHLSVLARVLASSTETTPTWLPSSSIRRTLGTLIFSLIRARLVSGGGTGIRSRRRPRKHCSWQVKTGSGTCLSGRGAEEYVTGTTGASREIPFPEQCASPCLCAGPFDSPAWI